MNKTENDIETMLDNMEKHYQMEKERNLIQKKCCDIPEFLKKNDCLVCWKCGVVSLDNKIFIDDAYSFDQSDVYFPSTSVSEYTDLAPTLVMGGNSRLSRVSNWNKLSYKDRVVWRASTELKGRLNSTFPNIIIEKTLGLYKKFYRDSDVKGGKKKIQDIASCLYFILMENGLCYSPKQIAVLMDIDVISLNKSIDTYSYYLHKAKIQKPEDYLQSYFNKFKIEFQFQKLIKQMVAAVCEMEIFSGCVPQSIASAVFAFTVSELGGSLSVKAISSYTQVSVSTIKKMISVITANKLELFHIIKQK